MRQNYTDQSHRNFVRDVQSVQSELERTRCWYRMFVRNDTSHTFGLIQG
jgi:hypothetical protein